MQKIKATQLQILIPQLTCFRNFKAGSDKMN